MSKRQNQKRRDRKARRRVARLLEAAAPDAMEMTCDVTLDLTAASDGQPPRLPTFTMQAYSGGRMRPKNFSQDVVVELSSVRAANETLPILRDHDHGKVVGHGRLEASSQGIHLEGTISGTGSDANEVIEAARNGFPWQASIGGAPRLESVGPGEKIEVNSQVFEGPLVVARDTVIREVSFVAVGADSQTSASIAASAAKGGMEMGFEAWLQNLGVEASGLSDEQLATYKRLHALEAGGEGATGEEDDNTIAASATGDDGAELELAGQRKARADEARRAIAIEASAKDYPDLVPEAIESGWSVEKTELEVAKRDLQKLRESRPQAAPAIHANEAKKDGDLFECALAFSGGVTEDFAAKHFSEETIEAAQSDRYRGFGIHRLFMEVIHAAGKSHPIGQWDNEFIRKAFECSADLQAQGFSTLSLPGILSNVANKTLLASYTMYPSIVPFAMTITSAPDFKPLYRYRLEGEGVLEKLGADGEIKHASLAEQEFMNRVNTYAKMLGLTRQMIINDDLNALTQAAAKLGEMAFKAHEYGAVDLIINPPDVAGTPFYDASHGNLIADPLAIAGLTAADTAMGKQTDSEGYPISVLAARLMLPQELKVTGSQLMTEARVNEDTAQGDPQPANNPWAGAFDYRATPWLSSSMVQNSSATAWWLLANPGSLAAFEVAYLNGRQTPVIESADADFNTLGVQQRAYHDWGFGIQDFRGVVKSTGTG